MKSLRRRIAATLSVLLIVTLTNVVMSPLPASASGPSIPLPGTPSTSVTEQTMTARQPDQASSRALTGNQPAGTTAPEGGGTATASPLSPSASWQVSGHTGDFTWSYPLRVPPAPGGLVPKLALSYASSAVDGRTSATNNQASWAGDGWDLSVGFIQRLYGGCADDTAGGTTPPKTGDLCWRTDNAMSSFPGGGGMLLADSSGKWRTESDDGSRIERFTGAGNGDNDGEYWKVTTTDGTQYFFGSRPEAKSTWTVPVFGDDANEPCHGNTFATSHCVQAWRWNLDKVVDGHGNVVHYGYTPETNFYGLNLTDTAVGYTRAGTLSVAEYGLREGSNAKATGRVEFTTADRCVPGSDCTPDKKENWPDTGWESRCDGGTCAGKYAPTFWTTKRLAKVTTQVLRGTQYADVDSWSLDHQFPDPGDGEKAALWLRSITHTGHVGATISLPPVTFEGRAMGNRVHKVDGLAPLNRYRVVAVVSESGGVVTVVYAAPECSPTALPANPESNTMRCFPVRWAKKGLPERTDYFHKHVVAEVTQSDRISSNIEQTTRYEYLDGAAWHYDMSEFTPDDKRTWNDFRGFSRVRVRNGADGGPSGPVTMTEQRFHRGMDGDTLPGGAKRSVNVADGLGGTRPDSDWLSGIGFYSATHLGDSSTIVAKSVSVPTWQGPTASRGSHHAYIVNTGSERSFTALASGGWRETRVDSSYDDRGVLIKVDDQGDTSTADDDRCTTTTYLRNNDKWILSLPSRSQTVSVKCATTPVFPRDAIGDTRIAYDGQGFEAAPARGDATRTEAAKDRPASGPVYQLSATAAFDAYGRPTKTADALGRESNVAYTPAIDAPATQAVTTNPAGFAVTTTLEPAWGVATMTVDANGRKTETAYDALGRTTEVWLPNRSKSKNPSGNTKYAYLIRNDAPSVVSTTSIRPNGNYTTTNTLYDGLLRVRQVQSPAHDGGRLIVDTRYDNQGRVYKTTKPYFQDGAVDDKLWVAADTDVPGRTLTEFDGAGRVKASSFAARDVEIRVAASYGGDRVQVTRPQGAPSTTTVVNARGQTTELLQANETTRYTYTKAGQLASITDQAGNVWRYTYDLLGRLIRNEDVDKGTATLAYDEAGQMVSTTDSRGVTLASVYDALGRRTSLRKDTQDGPKLAEWTYDTVPFGKGLPATSTRYVGDNAYVAKVLNYSALYQPTGTQITIPASEETLAGTYDHAAKYNVDGSLMSETLPAIGGLPAETVLHVYDDNGRATTTNGGYGGQTLDYVTDTQYTRYGELARLQLGETGKRVWQSYYYQYGTRRIERSIVDAELPRPMQTDVGYQYDLAGNITSLADTPQDLPADVQCFRYDQQRRLTEAWTPGNGCQADPNVASLTGPAPYWQSFRYDNAGNRTADTRRIPGKETQRQYTYPAGGGHDVSTVTTTDSAGTKTDSYAYDQAGNTTTRPGQVLDWDLEGHLGKVTAGSNTTEFVYGADGARLIRRDPTGTTLYLGGQQLRLDKASGVRTATRYYSHGGKTVAMREKQEVDGLTWLAGDHQNTAQLAVNAESLQINRRRQDPFGASRGDAAAFPGEKGFVGGTIDTSTGLTHLGAREYDPTLGRFISVDPILIANDSQQLNGYGYANNSPITLSDPSGLARTNCPDGECRGGGWDPGKSPASRFGNKPAANPGYVPSVSRCADGECPKGVKGIGRSANGRSIASTFRAKEYQGVFYVGPGPVKGEQPKVCEGRGSAAFDKSSITSWCEGLLLQGHSQYSAPGCEWSAFALKVGQVSCSQYYAGSPTKGEEKREPIVWLELHCTGGGGGWAFVGGGVEECTSPKEPGVTLHVVKLGGGIGVGASLGSSIRYVANAKSMEDTDGPGWYAEAGVSAGFLAAEVETGAHFKNASFANPYGGAGLSADPWELKWHGAKAEARLGLEYGWLTRN